MDRNSGVYYEGPRAKVVDLTFCFYSRWGECKKAGRCQYPDSDTCKLTKAGLTREQRLEARL